MARNDWLRQRLETAVVLFNRQEFFEAHDVFEDIWMEERSRERRFYQGLLHVAVGFYHYGHGNYKGALSQLTKAGQKLNAFLPQHKGLDVRNILDESAPFVLAARSRLNGLPSDVQPTDFPALRYKQTENDERTV